MSVLFWTFVVTGLYCLFPGKRPGPVPALWKRLRRWQAARHPSPQRIKKASTAFQTACPVAFLWPTVQYELSECVKRDGYIRYETLVGVLGVNPKTPEGVSLWKNVSTIVNKEYERG